MTPTNPALAAAAAATQTVATKSTQSKDSSGAQATTTTPSASQHTAGGATPAAAAALSGNGNAAPQSATPQGPSTPGAAVKTDQAGGAPSPTTASPASHDRSATTGTTGTLQPQAATPNPSLQVPGLPAQPPTAAPAATNTPIVTAATGAPLLVPVPMSGLALQLAASVQSGKTRFEMRLDPAELGRIDVRIDVDRNGQVTSHLAVEKPETLSMLRQDAPQLQQALNNAGLKTDGGGLQFSLRDQSSFSQNNGNPTGGNAQRLIIRDDAPVPATVAGQSYGRMLGSSSGVDIRV